MKKIYLTKEQTEQLQEERKHLEDLTARGESHRGCYADAKTSDVVVVEWSPDRE